MESAISALLASIENNPQNIQSYLSLARIYFKENQNDKAFSILLQAGEANTEDLNSRMLLATIYEKSGEVDKAVDVYESMLKIRR